MTDLPSLEEIRGGFAVLDDYDGKITYLIELSAKIPEFPPRLRSDDRIVPGCASRIWMHHAWADQRLDIQLAGEAKTVQGLLVILMAAYAHKTAPEILALEPRSLLGSVGLLDQLTSSRQNGFTTVARRIHSAAEIQARAPS